MSDEKPLTEKELRRLEETLHTKRQSRILDPLEDMTLREDGMKAVQELRSLRTRLKQAEAKVKDALDGWKESSNKLEGIIKDLEEGENLLREERDLARAEVERLTKLADINNKAAERERDFGKGQERRAEAAEKDAKMWKEQSDHAIKLGKEMEQKVAELERRLKEVGEK